MDNPDEFTRLCRMFHQDAPVLYPTPQEMAVAAVGSLDAEQRIVALRFVDRVLATGNASDAKRVLRKSPAEVFFGNAKSAHAFLQLIRDALVATR